jgi:hypothetical protein
LLKEENDEGYDKSNEVSLAKKCFLQSQTFPSISLFSDLRLNFGVFASNGFRMDVVPSQVSQISEGIGSFTF